MANQEPKVKGVAYDLYFAILDSSGNAVTGLTGGSFSSRTISKDNGAPAAISTAIVESSMTGVYKQALTAAEMNADIVVVKIVTALYGTYVFVIETVAAAWAVAGTAMALTTAERDATADALLDQVDGVETGFTLRQALRLVLSGLAGKLSGAATATITIRNVTDTKNRIIATVDADGNRTAVSTDVT